MKTAISVPDSIFERVERHARRLGVSRSEFFARAAARYADDLDDDRLVDAIDAVLEEDRDDASRGFVDAAAVATFERNPFDPAG